MHQSEQDLSDEHHDHDVSFVSENNGLTNTSETQPAVDVSRRRGGHPSLIPDTGLPPVLRREREAEGVGLASTNATCQQVSTDSSLATTFLPTVSTTFPTTQQKTPLDESTKSKLSLLNPTSAEPNASETKSIGKVQVIPPTSVCDDVNSINQELPVWDNLASESGIASTQRSMVEVGAVLVEHDVEEENLRLARENDALQQRLQGAIEVKPMVNENLEGSAALHNSPTGNKGTTILSSWKTWILLAVMLIGVALALVFSLSDSTRAASGLQPPGISTPTFVPTSTPTSLPSVYPTQRPSEQPSTAPTIGPSAQPSLSPTHTRRTSILQILVPTTSFDTSDAWDAFLMNNTETPQAQAIRWLVEEDEYSSEPINMPTQELEERYALVVFYYATSGPEWGPLVWFDYLNVTTSVCEWNTVDGEFYGTGDDNLWQAGVFCHHTGLVNFLLFSYNFMQGPLPSEIVLLRDLVYLNLYENYISGTLPPELGELSRLETVRIDDNWFRGPLPPFMPASLKTFSFGYNGLNGTLPKGWVTSATNLQHFLGYWNRLSGEIPPEWSNLDQLESLDLEYNKLNGTLPTEIGLMSSLEYINVYDNFISGTLPSDIGNLTKLMRLNFGDSGYHNNRLEGTIPSTIGLLTSLTMLDLGGNSLTGTLPSEMGLLSQLTSLGISDNSALSGTIPTEFRNLSNLNVIWFTGTSLTVSLDPNYCDFGTSDPQTLVFDCSSDIQCSCCSC